MEKETNEPMPSKNEIYTIEDYKALLKEVVRKHYKKVIEDYGEIYAYTLYSSDDATGIGPVCNRTSDIKVTSDDKDYFYYKYCADEYEIWEDYGLFSQVSQVMTQAIELAREIDNESDEDRWAMTRKRLFDDILEAMLELKEEGLFGTIDDHKYLAVWISDSASKIVEKSMEKLNTTKVYEECKSML